MYFSKSTLGFYDNPANYPDAPTDLVAIPDDLYLEMMQAGSRGLMIAAGDDGLPVAVEHPPLTAAALLANNVAERSRLLASAAEAIAPLQDAADLDIATDAETALLKLWKQYRVALNRLDLTAQPVAWPALPGDVA